MAKPYEPDYESLAELRFQIRRFLHFSERAARGAGLEPAQHQLLLALKGLPASVPPHIGELAKRLIIRHHSAVELINRLAKAGLVRRQRDAQDRRQVLISLTPRGEEILRQLSLHHNDELRAQGPKLLQALRVATRAKNGANASRSRVRSGEGSAWQSNPRTNSR